MIMPGNLKPNLYSGVIFGKVSAALQKGNCLTSDAEGKQSITIQTKTLLKEKDDNIRFTVAECFSDKKFYEFCGEIKNAKAFAEKLINIMGYVSCHSSVYHMNSECRHRFSLLTRITQPL